MLSYMASPLIMSTGSGLHDALVEQKVYRYQVLIGHDLTYPHRALVASCERARPTWVAHVKDCIVKRLQISRTLSEFELVVPWEGMPLGYMLPRSDVLVKYARRIATQHLHELAHDQQFLADHLLQAIYPFATDEGPEVVVRLRPDHPRLALSPADVASHHEELQRIATALHLAYTRGLCTYMAEDVKRMHTDDIRRLAERYGAVMRTHVVTDDDDGVRVLFEWTTVAEPEPWSDDEHYMPKSKRARSR